MQFRELIGSSTLIDQKIISALLQLSAHRYSYGKTNSHQMKRLQLICLLVVLLGCKNRASDMVRPIETEVVEAIVEVKDVSDPATKVDQVDETNRMEGKEVKVIEVIANKTSAMEVSKSNPTTKVVTHEDADTSIKTVESIDLGEKEEAIVKEVEKNGAIDVKIKNDVPLSTGHELWNQLLQKYVSVEGRVNYSALKKEEASLDEYLEYLSRNAPSTALKTNEAKAFWINAYNAFTIKRILKDFPVGSIMELDGGQVWDVKWIKLGTKTHSLNDIEHKILRPVFGDPRIHFAVNCAAKSCPKIWNRAWTSDNIEEGLTKLTKEFVNNTVQNTIKPDQLQLSKIFDWYKTDFGDIAGFISQYSNTKISANPKITYKEYIWSLNGM